MIRLTQCLCASAVLCALAAFSSAAYADGRNYNDGPVVNVSFIRTVDGHFDDYMQWLATTWKKQEEAAKKAGLIIGYEVDVAQPQGPNDADVILIALDTRCQQLHRQQMGRRCGGDLEMAPLVDVYLSRVRPGHERLRTVVQPVLTQLEPLSNTTRSLSHFYPRRVNGVDIRRGPTRVISQRHGGTSDHVDLRACSGAGQLLVQGFKSPEDAVSVKDHVRRRSGRRR